MSLVLRRHAAAGIRSVAAFSACGAYRYLLARRWRPGPRLVFVLLNPSTADETRNDPTVARCEARARRLGYGGFAVANLFAFRSVRPSGLRAAADPVGPLNDRILAAAAGAGVVVCGWGNHGALGGRGEAVRRMLDGADLRHLGLTRAGHPRHPLYVAAARPLAAWEG